MARISGVDLPNKRAEISLTYVFGIGRTTSAKILDEAKIDKNKRMNDLSEEELNSIRQIIDKSYSVEGQLRGSISMDIKRLMDIRCYRGLRHRRGLPVRGQNTKNNSRTRKGRRGSPIKKK